MPRLQSCCAVNKARARLAHSTTTIGWISDRLNPRELRARLCWWRNAERRGDIECVALLRRTVAGSQRKVYLRGTVLVASQACPSFFFTPGFSGDRNPQTGPMETTGDDLRERFFGWGQSACSIHSVNQLKLVPSR